MADGLLKVLKGFLGYWNGDAATEIDVATDVDRLAEDDVSLTVAAEATAGTAKTKEYFHVCRTAKTVKAINLMPSGALTAADTDFKTVKVTQGATLLAQLTTELASGDWVAGTVKALTLSSTAIAAGAALAVEITVDGNGIATPEFCVTVSTIDA
jgi:hypothetical protein